MDSIISHPAFSDIAFSHLGKTYYSSRCLLVDQLSLIQPDDTSSFIQIPSVQGPFDKFLSFLHGNQLKITEQNRAFYLIMYDFFGVKHSQISDYFAKNPNKFRLKDCHTIYQYLYNNSKPSRSDNCFISLLLNLDRYINLYPDPILPSYIIQLALKHRTDAKNALTLNNSIKIFKILLKQLSNCTKFQFFEICDTIVDFLNEYPAAELIQLTIKSPYFDLNRIDNLLKPLLKDENDETFFGYHGFFETHPHHSNIPLYYYSSSKDPQHNLDDSHPIYDINEFDITTTYSLESTPSYIIFGFRNRTFDLTEYSFTIAATLPFPRSWILYATNDMKTYTVIDRVENNTEGTIRKKVTTAFPFALAFKFEFLESTYANGEASKVFVLDNFDIFGVYHSSFLNNSKKLFVLETNREPHTDSDDLPRQEYIQDRLPTLNLIPDLDEFDEYYGSSGSGNSDDFSSSMSSPAGSSSLSDT